MQPIQQFSAKEQSLLRRIAGRVIPESTERGLPGADDTQIFDRVRAKAARQGERLPRALSELLAAEGGIDAAVAWDDVQLAAWIDEWAQRWPSSSHSFFYRFIRVLLEAYYQDPRVQQAHGRRPGPPFPEGYDVPQGDWSLLEPVRSKPPMYRS